MKAIVCCANHYEQAGMRAELEESGVIVAASVIDQEAAAKAVVENAADVVVLAAPNPAHQLLPLLMDVCADRSAGLVTVHRTDQLEPVASLRRGVRGLVYADGPSGELPRATSSVAAGAIYISAHFTSAVVSSLLPWDSMGIGSLSQESLNRLTRREREVVNCVLEEMTNREIAQRLTISEKTVKFHVSNVLAKFGVRSRRQLILQLVQSLNKPGS